MVKGNFALLAGIDPDQVDAWYLGIYIAAIQWVEIVNTRGMSQLGDGGLVATKPYVSTANYIREMSDYCDHCHYDTTRRVGDGACPFNSLYLDFLDRQRGKLANNPRIGMIYRVWDAMAGAERKAIRQHAENLRQHLDTPCNGRASDARFRFRAMSSGT